MLVSLIAYVLGYCLFAIIYCEQARTLESKEEKVKWIIATILLSALWPVIGVWMLWELLSVVITIKKCSYIEKRKA